jgi:hypothetical protein
VKVDDANRIEEANVKSGENRENTVEYRERNERTFGAADLLGLLVLQDEGSMVLQNVRN